MFIDFFVCLVFFVFRQNAGKPGIPEVSLRSPPGKLRKQIISSILTSFQKRTTQMENQNPDDHFMLEAVVGSLTGFHCRGRLLARRFESLKNGTLQVVCPINSILVENPSGKIHVFNVVFGNP